MEASLHTPPPPSSSRSEGRDGKNNDIRADASAAGSNYRRRSGAALLSGHTRGRNTQPPPKHPPATVASRQDTASLFLPKAPPKQTTRAYLPWIPPNPTGKSRLARRQKGASVRLDRNGRVRAPVAVAASGTPTATHTPSCCRQKKPIHVAHPRCPSIRTVHVLPCLVRQER